MSHAAADPASHGGQGWVGRGEAICRKTRRPKFSVATSREGVELRESDPREVVPLRLEVVAAPLDIVQLEAMLSEAAE